jgi:hypothetical protein
MRTLTFSQWYANRPQLENAATALLMGMSPADPEASAVWPGVGADWYWPTELPKVTDYLEAAQLSYAYKMPLLGQFSGDRTMRFLDYDVQSVGASVPRRRIIENSQTAVVNVNDSRWRDGIWIASKAGNVVISGEGAAKQLADGDELIFGRSGRRTVVRVGTGSPLQVELDGGSLDPEGDGYPHTVRLRIGRAAIGAPEEICRLTGSIASFKMPGIIAPRRLIPVTNLHGIVVGYGAREKANIFGHMVCAEALNHPPLFWSEPN